jgi:hypothetical protein
MFDHQTFTKRRVRGAVKTTRKALNRALDAAEPRLEAAVVELQDIGQDAVAALRKGTRKGMRQVGNGYGMLEQKLRRATHRRSLSLGKLALLVVGVAAIAVGLLRSNS